MILILQLIWLFLTFIFTLMNFKVNTNKKFVKSTLDVW